jgi:hypothetical protein
MKPLNNKIDSAIECFCFFTKKVSTYIDSTANGLIETKDCKTPRPATRKSVEAYRRMNEARDERRMAAPVIGRYLLRVSSSDIVGFLIGASRHSSKQARRR